MKLSFVVNCLKCILENEGDMDLAIIMHNDRYQDFMADYSFKIDVVGVPDETGLEKKCLGFLSGQVFEEDAEMGAPNLRLID